MLQEDSVVGIWCFFSYMVRIGLYQTLYIVRFLPVGVWGKKSKTPPRFWYCRGIFAGSQKSSHLNWTKKIIRKKSVGHENDHYPWRVVVSCPAGGLGVAAQPMTTQPVETVDFLLSKAARLDKARLWWQFPTLCEVFLVTFLSKKKVCNGKMHIFHTYLYMYIGWEATFQMMKVDWVNQLLDINLHVTHQSYTNLSPKYQDFYHWCDMFCSNTGGTHNRQVIQHQRKITK